jgi:S-adenosylmethionine hydrolase
MNRPVITLLTDFGTSDHYVGAMKGVMLGICPDAQLVDITHEIRPYQIADAAFTLSQAWPYFPAGSIHLIVVDPGVGSSRRPLVAEADGHIFVAPDNGVLTLVQNSAAGFNARQISAERFFRQPVSRTFHGRDIFAPVAAHLAQGVRPEEFGNRIGDPVTLPFANPLRTGPESWTGTVLHVDRFGNIVTNFRWPDFSEVVRTRFEIGISASRVNVYYANYSSAAQGEFFVINGSSGYLEISSNQQDAASLLAVSAGSEIKLRLDPRHFQPETR